uniref:NADH dehydrogenase subunit 6 n=1 Tax=Hydromanicus huapingensis TaxID=1875469 RepID=UPI0022381E71|nr:NADH dehydrogenase subunit 6 [Hydromanicus huapingensis]UYO79250.1 NADH dehydrogenase subunit 6 [Hydromanicus huapingensis]
MTKLMLTSIMILLTVILMITKNPLLMGFLIIIQTLMLCLMMNFNSSIYWMSYITYLIMLGGILILFMYMCSISSNETIKFNTNIALTLPPFLMFMMFNFLSTKWINKNMSMTNYSIDFFLNNNNIINISKMYNKFSMIITIMLITYLLISLTMVTTFTNNNLGPLRSSK